MTVEELIARLQILPPDAQVQMSVPQPGDDYYNVEKVIVETDEWIVLYGEEE